LGGDKLFAGITARSQCHSVFVFRLRSLTGVKCSCTAHTAITEHTDNRSSAYTILFKFAYNWPKLIIGAVAFFTNTSSVS
jgi:hypothetical protein